MAKSGGSSPKRLRLFKRAVNRGARYMEIAPTGQACERAVTRRPSERTHTGRPVQRPLPISRPRVNGGKKAHEIRSRCVQSSPRRAFGVMQPIAITPIRFVAPPLLQFIAVSIDQMFDDDAGFGEAQRTILDDWGFSQGGGCAADSQAPASSSRPAGNE